MKTERTIDIYPLSPMKQGMLFHSLSSARGAGVDVEQIFCALREELNVEAFQSAWQRVVERHPVLRTSFDWQGSATPRQRVHPRVEFEFSRRDWRNVSGDKRKKLFADWLEAERRRGFDLAAAPLMRLATFHNGKNESQFLW